MKPHDKIPGWLVDDDGNIFTRVNEFTCPNHPYGPSREHGDELTACEQLTLYLLDELNPEAVCTVAVGATLDLIKQAREDLGICCRGHQWRDTGELREVGALEIFLRLNMSGEIFGRPSILLEELNRGADANWQGEGVRIPLIVSVHREGAGPQEIFPNRYSLDPAKPPTVE